MDISSPQGSPRTYSEVASTLTGEVFTLRKGADKGKDPPTPTSGSQLQVTKKGRSLHHVPHADDSAGDLRLPLDPGRSSRAGNMSAGEGPLLGVLVPGGQPETMDVELREGDAAERKEQSIYS